MEHAKATAPAPTPAPDAERSNRTSTVPAGEPLPVIKGSHVYLIDGSGYIFRAFHALPPLTRPSDGLPVGAVHGFCQMLWKLLGDSRRADKPTHIAVIFDAGRETFRNAIYPLYKAQRPPAPEELIPQFSLIRDAVAAFNIASIEQDGFEADDIIATYARDVVAAGGDATIVSSDKDLMQLIQPGIVMLDGMKNKRLGPDEVFEKFGVAPNKVIDVQALAGDSVDNVPGVPGIGVKTAAALIRETGGLDRILEAKDESEFDDLRERLMAIQVELNLLAGEEVKLGSGPQLAKVLIAKFGVAEHQFKQNKKDGWTADTAAIQSLADNGNEFCQKIIQARDLGKIVASHIGHVRAHASVARISRELVTLKQDVPVEFPLDRLGVTEPDPAALLGFLQLMEFNTLTSKIAIALGAEPPPRLPVSVGASVAKKTGPDTAASPSGPGTPAAGAAYHLARIKAVPFKRSDYATVTNLEQLAPWIEAAREAGRLAFDTETTGLDAMTAGLVGLSIATAPGRACYVPFAHVAGGGGFDFGDAANAPQAPLRETLAALKPLLEDGSILKIGHNIKFDLLVMARHGITITPIDDTMLLSYALDGGRGEHGMDALSLRHLGHACLPFGKIIEFAPGGKKGEKTFAGVPIDKATEYAAEDADVTLRLWEVLRPRLPAERQTVVYETLERPLVPIIVDMERAGIKVDRAILGRLSSQFAQSIVRLDEEVQQLAGFTFNLGSPKQLGELLFDRLKLPGGKRTKTGQWETRAGLLDDLAANEELPDDARLLVNKMMEWRQLSKLRSTYTDSLPEFMDAQGRIHTSYSLASTTTGRLASSEPNLQNIPIRTKEGREIRTAFIAETGHQLISADYSQIELRVLAHIADIPQLKKAFAEGLDIHAMTASEMFGVPIKDMPSDVRRRAKAINFGIIYGISAFGLANQLGISREEAGQYIKTYFARFPGIRDYMDRTKKFAHDKGYVETVFGRRIHYPEINTKNPSMRGFLERAAINAPIQGSAADIIRRAMIRMPHALEAAGLKSARMLLQVHDELVFEAKDADVAGTLAVAVRVMEAAPMPAVQMAVPVRVDAKAAANWEAAH